MGLGLENEIMWDVFCVGGRDVGSLAVSCKLYVYRERGWEIDTPTQIHRHIHRHTHTH